MKKIILFTFLLLGKSMLAQDIKVKKGDVLIDNSRVAKIETKKGISTISSIEGTPVFTIKIKRHTLPDNKFKTIGTVSNIDETKTNEFELKDIAFTMSNEKHILNNIILGDLKLINSQGIDEKVLTDFFNSEKTNLNHEYANAKIEYEKALKQEEDLVKKYDLIIDNNGNIYAKGVYYSTLENKKEAPLYPGKYHVGRIVRETYSFGGFGKDVLYKYFITDLYNNQMAVWLQNSNYKGHEELKTWDNKSYYVPYVSNVDFKSGRALPLGKDLLALNIVKKLFVNGIILGDQGQRIKSH